jgi:hypothetical protein
VKFKASGERRRRHQGRRNRDAQQRRNPVGRNEEDSLAASGTYAFMLTEPEGPVFPLSEG